MSSNKISDTIRQQVIKSWLQGAYSTKAQLARSYNISPRSVGRIISEYEEQHDVDEDDFYDYGLPTYTFIFTANELRLFRENPDEYDDEPFELLKIDRANLSENDLAALTRVMGDQNDSYEFNECLHELWNKFDLQAAADRLSQNTNFDDRIIGSIFVSPKQGVVKIEDENGNDVILSSRLGNRLIDALINEDHITFESLIQFTHNLNENPSHRVFNELYDFLLASDIEINEDGMVVCYKRVSDDYKDVYTGTIDNSVGSAPTVPRHQVNEDSSVTCSHGLHVCSRAYLKHYSGSRIIQCIVHPKDFVSIPEDYYSCDENGEIKAKARVCSYYVSADLTEEMKNYV